MKLRNILAKGIESFRQEPLVELVGYRRVLIENHLGIHTYSECMVQVQLSFGTLCVSGTDLQILQIQKDQLVIRGNINALQLERR